MIKNSIITVLSFTILFLSLELRYKSEAIKKLKSESILSIEREKKCKEDCAAKYGVEFEHGLSYAINRCLRVADMYKGYNQYKIREACNKIRY